MVAHVSHVFSVQSYWAIFFTVHIGPAAAETLLLFVVVVRPRCVPFVMIIVVPLPKAACGTHSTACAGFVTFVVLVTVRIRLTPWPFVPFVVLNV